MIVTECKYDPAKDMQAVEPFGFVDLKDALVNNCVPSQLPDSDTDYNGIEDPDAILGRPSDVFDALRMQTDMDARVSAAKVADGYNKSEKP